MAVAPCAGVATLAAHLAPPHRGTGGRGCSNSDGASSHEGGIREGGPLRDGLRLCRHSAAVARKCPSPPMLSGHEGRGKCGCQAGAREVADQVGDCAKEKKETRGSEADPAERSLAESHQRPSARMGGPSRRTSARRAPDHTAANICASLCCACNVASLNNARRHEVLGTHLRAKGRRSRDSLVAMPSIQCVWPGICLR